MEGLLELWCSSGEINCKLWYVLNSCLEDLFLSRLRSHVYLTSWYKFAACHCHSAGVRFEFLLRTGISEDSRGFSESFFAIFGITISDCPHVPLHYVSWSCPLINASYSSRVTAQLHLVPSFNVHKLCLSSTKTKMTQLYHYSCTYFPRWKVSLTSSYVCKCDLVPNSAVIGLLSLLLFGRFVPSLCCHTVPPDANHVFHLVFYRL
jgi:hypothetical protein